jgi:lipooligosaccharide transport system ATP-binding protein
MTEPLLDARQLTKRYGDTTVVDGLSFRIDAGECLGVIGPNGAGKTTTIRMCLGLTEPDDGAIHALGLQMPRDALAIKAQLGVVSQFDSLDPDFSCAENLMVYGRYFRMPEQRIRERIPTLLEFAALTHKANARPGELSGGMRRRLSLARALVNDPRLLMLDEPTTGLDPQSRSALWDEVARLANDDGVTVFLTTQYLEEADVLADRVGIIDRGKIVAEGTPEALKAEVGRPSLEVTPSDQSGCDHLATVLGRFGDAVDAPDGAVAVRLERGADELAAVVRALDAESVGIEHFQLHSPSLDDVFLAKTGHKLEAEAEDDTGERERVPA